MHAFFSRKMPAAFSVEKSFCITISMIKSSTCECKFISSCLFVSEILFNFSAYGKIYR